MEEDIGASKAEALAEALGDAYSVNVLSENRFIESADDIADTVSNTSADTLLAGAADLFEAVINKCFPSRTRRKCTFPHIDFSSEVMILRGSTQSQPLSLDIPLSVMPDDTYLSRTDYRPWISDAERKYSKDYNIILSMPSAKGPSGRDSAVWRREAMADMAIHLIDIHQPKELIIEGGATAFTTLAKTRWDNFSISEEIAPGVVRMAAESGCHVTMKPGSYDWGNLFGKNNG